MGLILQANLSRFLIPIVFLFTCAAFIDSASASYPPDPTGDTEWPYSSEITVWRIFKPASTTPVPTKTLNWAFRFP